MLIAELNIIEPIAFGYNSSSVLLSAFYGTINNSGVIMHNPAAFDPDGDRLHFDLLDYRIYPGVSVPYTIRPRQINRFINANFTAGLFFARPK